MFPFIGYDPDVVAELSAEEQHSLRAACLVWLVAFVTLGAAAAYAGWVLTLAPWAAAVAGVGVFSLSLNLVRVVTAGGGKQIGRQRAAGDSDWRHYRPSLAPGLVLLVVAVLLAQPAQLAFRDDLDAAVAEHRQRLIARHEAASTGLGAEAGHYRELLASSYFPIYRLQLVWREPRRAVRMTFIMCVVVLLPIFWTQLIAIRSLRSYNRQRYRRALALGQRFERETGRLVDRLLRPWPTYRRAAGRGASHG